VKRLVDVGTKEISLLGQTVNSYGKNMAEGKVPFSELLYLVASVPGIERIRFTSPYPRDFKLDVIQAIRDIPQVMEHVHMPLQAGSNSELKRMRRLYTIEEFKDIVAEVRSEIPSAGVTTDLIVGFPDETEVEYQATLQAVREIQFDAAYMFAYSPRPGTIAATWENQISDDIKKARLNELIALQSEVSLAKHQELINQTFEVLVEGVSPNDKSKLFGLTREFRQMRFSGSPERVGRLARVKVTKAHRWGLAGELV
jgi:tRNA-2-methylthio-N6-dimethylallyladenosine synthase